MAGFGKQLNQVSGRGARDHPLHLLSSYSIGHDDLVGSGLTEFLTTTLPVRFGNNLDIWMEISGR